MNGNQIAETVRQPLQEHWGYIWGKSGQLFTRNDYEEILKTKAGNSNYKLAIKYGEKWIGHKVADCSGLVVWVYKQFGMSVPHGSNSLWKNCKEKGKISGDIPTGALVFKLRNSTDYYHVGIYVGNGKVVEAKGTVAGVVESGLSGWGYYGLLSSVEHEEVVPVEKGTIAVVDVPNDGTLWVRKSPSTQAGKKDVLLEGDEVEVLDVSGDWAKVRYTSEGYVMAKFLRG